MTDKDTDDDPTPSITMTLGDEEIKLKNVRIQTQADARAELEQMKDDAPDPEYLTESRTSDIDEVIEALQAAKERGVDTVCVNDDGRTMATRPRLTNNLVGRSTMAPPPGELNEYVEL